MTNPSPRVFISYSWSSSEFVLGLAKRLTADGVYVVIDKWELREGYDLNAFMERMITDQTIDRVLVISNSQYAEKSNNATGGVGTESQIIRPTIYKSMRQEKFVPIVLERHSDGSACLPVYMLNRVYIDFSDNARFDQEYIKLLRNIYNEPADPRPPIGTPPQFSSNHFSSYLPESEHSVIAKKESDHTLVPLFPTKHRVPGGNEWWNNLANGATKRFYLIGYTNKSWINKSTDQSRFLANNLIRIAKNDGIVKITSNSNEETVTKHREFLDRFIKDQVKEEDNNEEDILSNIVYHVSPMTNYNAVISDDLLVMMPVLNTEEFRDESMVFQINRSSSPQPFANYLGDIERLMSKSEIVEWK